MHLKKNVLIKIVLNFQISSTDALRAHDGGNKLNSKTNYLKYDIPSQLHNFLKGKS